MKKDQIIDISLDLFLKNGYEQTTITDIMRQANLSKGGMYHHFASKEDILEAVVRKAMEEEQNNFNNIVVTQKDFASKFMLFFLPSYAPSPYLESFMLFTKNQKKSLLYYKFREIKREYGTKALNKIIYDGIKLNHFKVEYVEEVSSLLYIYGEDISFRSLELKAEYKRNFLIKEFTAFKYVIKKLLNPSEEFINDFYDKLILLAQTRI